MDNSQTRISLRKPVYDKEGKRIVRFRLMTVPLAIWTEQKELRRRMDDWLLANPKNVQSEYPSKQPNPAWKGFVEDDGTPVGEVPTTQPTQAQIDAMINAKAQQLYEAKVAADALAAMGEVVSPDAPPAAPTAKAGKAQPPADPAPATPDAAPQA